MHIHNLSRGAKGALVLLLSIAILLPLILLLPRYFAWKEGQVTQRVVNGSYTASLDTTLTP